MSSNDGPVNRRSSHVDMPVAYAAVGASKAPDLLRFPPSGSTPYEESLRLGSGEERFLLASSLLMTWGAQRGAGMRVSDVVRGPDDEYEGVVFDGDGQAQAAAPREDTFGPDGEPYLNPGTEATVTASGGEPRRVLVVYTIDEPRRVGFAWGTGDENGAIGEQCFAVERREDDTVWAVARGFLTAPRAGLLGLKARSDLRSAIEDVKRQLQALMPGAAAEAAPAGGAAAAVDDAVPAAAPGATGEGEAAVEVEAGPADAHAGEGSAEAEPEVVVAEPGAPLDEPVAEPDAQTGEVEAVEVIEGEPDVETAEVEMPQPAAAETAASEYASAEPAEAEVAAETGASAEADAPTESTGQTPAPRTTHQRRPSRPAGRQGE